MRRYYYTEKKGRDVVCNKCGRTVFSKRVKEHTITGGAYIPEVYEDLPEGWKLGNEEDLCPSCVKKFG